MSQTLKKRGREPEAVPASIDVWETKRFHSDDNDRFRHLLQLDETLSQEEEECAPSEEVINEVMKSLEEEIGTTCFTSYLSSNSGDNSASSDISSGQEGETLASESGFDLSYLLEASDDELGIPFDPVLDFKDEVWPSTGETLEGLLENPDPKFLGEIWHLEDIENYLQFALYEDACEASQTEDYMNRVFLGPDMFLEAEFSAAWISETPGCL